MFTGWNNDHWSNNICRLLFGPTFKTLLKEIFHGILNSLLRQTLTGSLALVHEWHGVPASQRIVFSPDVGGPPNDPRARRSGPWPAGAGHMDDPPMRPRFAFVLYYHGPNRVGFSVRTASHAEPADLIHRPTAQQSILTVHSLHPRRSLPFSLSLSSSLLFSLSLNPEEFHTVTFAQNYQ